MNKIITNNKSGGTAIYMTMVILSAILVVSLSASNMILNGMRYNRARYDSAKAFYAAETGAEQIIWEVRSLNIDPLLDCPDDKDIFCFDDALNGNISDCKISCTGANIATTTFNNGAENNIIFELEHHADINLSSTTLTSVGIYKDEIRRIKLTYRSGE